MGGWGGWEDGRMGGWEDGRMGGWEDGRMGGWEDGRMGGWEDGRMGGWEDGRMGGRTCAWIPFPRQTCSSFSSIVTRSMPCWSDQSCSVIKGETG